jgi:CRISPR-associated protein Cmr1
MPMGRVQLQIEFVTPCFLGGVDRSAPAEWRALSVRGQLRWWFRAFAGLAFQGDLSRVREAETALFGSTERSSTLRIRTSGEPRTVGKEEMRWGRDASLVYIGYGAILRNKEDKRIYVEHGRIDAPTAAAEALETAGLELQWRRDLTDEERDLLRKALWSWLNLGGIGARNRRGFGSLRCRSADSDALGNLVSPVGRGAFRRQVQEILKTLETAPASLPTWSHLSGQTRIYAARQGRSSWMAALQDVGDWFKEFRKTHRSFSGKVPVRAGFGLPLQFGEKPEIATWGTSAEDRRRASPLLVHVARFEAQGRVEYVPVLTHLPALLIPEGEKLFVKDDPYSGTPPDSRHLGIVKLFLDSLCQPDGPIAEIKPEVKP